MKIMYSLCVILAFTLVSTFNVFTCFAGQSPGSAWRVMIVNYVKTQTLAVHCKSEDIDLGLKILAFKEEYYWEFKENSLQSTSFSCGFNSEIRRASFQVFWPEKGHWLSDRCNISTCIWAADEKGFFLFNIQTQTFEKIHEWNSTTKPPPLL